jgi:hypothetical protein
MAQPSPRETGIVYQRYIILCDIWVILQKVVIFCPRKILVEEIFDWSKD